MIVLPMKVLTKEISKHCFLKAESVVTVCELIISPHFYTNNEDYEGCTDSWSWDTDAKTRAQGILASFRNFEFSVCIVALKNILMPLRGITSKLQKRDLDIYEAFCDVESVVKDVKTMHRGIDERDEVGTKKFFILRDALEAKKNNLE